MDKRAQLPAQVHNATAMGAAAQHVATLVGCGRVREAFLDAAKNKLDAEQSKKAALMGWKFLTNNKKYEDAARAAREFFLTYQEICTMDGYAIPRALEDSIRVELTHAHTLSDSLR